MIVAPAELASFSPNLLHDVQVMLQIDFMRRAFLAGTAIALVSGLIGYFVIVRRLVFSSDVLSHVAFPGALGAIVLGFSPLLGVFGLAVAVALGMGLLGGRRKRRDVTTGTVQTWIFGVGALLLSLYTRGQSARNSAAGVNILFGSLFGISARTVWISVALSLRWWCSLRRSPARSSSHRSIRCWRRLGACRFDSLDLLFLVLLAVTVAIAVQAVGALLIIALARHPGCHRTSSRRPARSRPCWPPPFSHCCFTWIGSDAGLLSSLSGELLCDGRGLRQLRRRRDRTTRATTRSTAPTS